MKGLLEITVNSASDLPVADVGAALPPGRALCRALGAGKGAACPALLAGRGMSTLWQWQVVPAAQLGGPASCLAPKFLGDLS